MSNQTQPTQTGGAEPATQPQATEARTATKHWHPALMNTSLASIRSWLLAVLAGEGADAVADGISHTKGLPVITRTTAHALHAMVHVSALRIHAMALDDIEPADVLAEITAACYEDVECCDLTAAQFAGFVRSLESCLQYLESYVERCPHDEPRVRIEHAHYAIAHLAEISRWHSGAKDISSAFATAKMTAFLLDPGTPESPTNPRIV